MDKKDASPRMGEYKGKDMGTSTVSAILQDTGRPAGKAGTASVSAADEEIVSMGHGGSAGPESRRKKSGLFRYLFRCLLWVFVSVFVFLCACSVYLYVNRDEIKTLFIQEINKNLRTPVSVQNVQLGLLHDFPKVSVSFLGTACYGMESSDPEILFTAENITLSFNLRDLLRKEYVVREILVRGGDFNLKHYGNGVYNYVIWKVKSDSSRAVSFHLQKVVLRNTLVRFRDIPARHDFQVLARNLNAKGDLFRSGQEFQLKGGIDIHGMCAAGFNFLSRRKARIDVHFYNDQENKCFTVKKGGVEIANLIFDASGYVRYRKPEPFMDFRFVGRKMRMEALVSLLPEQEKSLFSDYSFVGNIGFVMDIKGDYTKNPLQVNADFDLSDGSVKHKPSKIEVSGLNFKGSFTNGSTRKASSCRLKVDRISADLPSGRIEGTFSIDNFQTPQIRYSGRIHADLSELQQFAGFLPAYRMKGYATADFDFNNIFPALRPEEWKTSDFNRAFVDGELSLRSFRLEHEGMPEFYSDSLRIHFTPQVFKTDYFTCMFDGSAVKARFFIENALPFLFFKGQNLYVTADIDADHIDLERLAPQYSEPEGKKKVAEKDSGAFADRLSRMYADVNLRVSELSLKETKVRKLKGFFRYAPEDMTLEKVSFEVFQGRFDGDLSWTKKGNTCRLDAVGQIEGFDIGACFRAFDNFGQKQLTYNNIGGELSTRFRLSVPYDLSTGQWVSDSLSLWSQAEIRHGVLQNMESLKRISRFTGENDLQDIRFADLNSLVRIENRSISISRTDVHSDAANLVFSGSHGFDNKVDYLVNIELSDLLSRRRAKRVKREEEFGVVNQDNSKIMLPLHITGTWPEVEVKYAMKEARKGAGQRLQENRDEFRQALDEEYAQMRQKREERNSEREEMKRRENGEFVISIEETGLRESPAKKRPADTLKAKKKKKYNTQEDFRIEFDEE